MARRTNTFRSFASPSRYIQGEGILAHLQQFTDAYGKKIVFIIDCNLFDEMKSLISSLYDAGHELSFFPKRGEITLASLDDFDGQIKEEIADVFVGVGGGKTIDTAKMLAQRFARPVVIVPTVASTDAPTSALSVIYKESGEHSHEVFQPQNPNMVIVDSAVIAKAPVRLLVSGMGDALSTYFEASANDASNSDNVVSLEMNLSMGPSLAAKELARLCHEVLIRDGRKAKISAEMGIVTPALENVIEANTLLSGIGFESNGTAAAHAIGDGITAVPTEGVYYHGERVAFGVLCELILTNASDAMLDEIYRFCVDVGLPVTLRQLGIAEITEDVLNIISNVADHNVVHAEHRVITPESVKSAIRTADAIGKDYLSGKYSLRS